MSAKRKAVWSIMQTDVFENVESGKGHTVVRARAGTGKTTTIVEALKYIPEGLKTLMVAFNKSIAEELQARVPAGVEASTLHSFGMRALTKALGRKQLENDRTMRLATAMLGGDYDSFTIRRELCKLVSLAKGSLTTEIEALDALCDTFSIEAPTTSKPRAEFLLNAQKLLTQSRENITMIDFDDMIWLPVVLGLKVPQFDRVVIDETQDLNAAQIELAMMACKKNGRILAVGDDRQSIYQFRGADASALDNVVTRLGATVLPLSITYRCAATIVAEAQTIVPDYTCAPGAPEGMVHRGVTEETMVKTVKPGDFILSRANAPLVRLCLEFIRAHVPAVIQGRDVGASLATLIKKSGESEVPLFLEWLDDWRDREVARLAKKNASTQAVEDKYGCLLALCEGQRSTNAILAKIESLFADKSINGRIVLSTTHKAKGLERDRVFVLANTYRKRPGIEEANLYYVAVTRAKSELYLVQIPEAKPREKSVQS